MTDENKLNGNDAVNLAAEQSKNTAHRNIPELGFEDMPLAADTANLRYGPSLHDGLLALLPLVGVWTGGTVTDAENSMAELALLAETAGSEVLEAVFQRRQSPDPATFIGRGKVEAIREIVQGDLVPA